MILTECYFDYVLRTSDVDTLKHLIKGCSNLIKRYKKLVKRGVAVDHLNFIIEQYECHKEMYKKALKIKRSEVKNEKNC